MKNKLKNGLLALAITSVFYACSSNNSTNRTSDSIDSIRNDTSSFDISSQRDSTSDATGTDTSGTR